MAKNDSTVLSSKWGAALFWALALLDGSLWLFGFRYGFWFWLVFGLAGVMALVIRRPYATTLVALAGAMLAWHRWLVPYSVDRTYGWFTPAAVIASAVLVVIIGVSFGLRLRLPRRQTVSTD